MTFHTFHPAIAALYYLLLIIMGLATKNPLVIGIVLLGVIMHFAVVYSIKETVTNCIYYLFFTLLIVLVSGAFKHNGVTPLFFWNEQAVTKESLVWGAIIGIASMFISFLCKNLMKNLPMDRLLYLCRRIWPLFGIYLSLAARFIPTFKKRLSLMNAAQKSIGYYATASFFDKLNGYVKTYYECASWSFEQCFHKSDAMKNRGFHLKGKTAFIFYKWRRIDTVFTIILFALFSIFLFYFEQSQFYYFPYTKAVHLPNLMLLCLFMFAILPIVITIKERVIWHYYNLKL